MKRATNGGKTEWALVSLRVAIFIVGLPVAIAVFIDFIAFPFSITPASRTILDKNTVKLMPEGFENVYLMMPKDELLEVRKNSFTIDGTVGPGWECNEKRAEGWDCIENPGNNIFSHVHFETHPRWRGSAAPPGPRTDNTLRVGQVSFAATTDETTVRAYLKRSILKYGRYFGRFYKDGMASLVWDIGDNRVILSWRSSSEKDETKRWPSMSLTLYRRMGYSLHWERGVESNDALKHAFEPYQATIAEALKELATSGTQTRPVKSVEPDTTTSTLMPKGFKNLHLKMTREDLLKARPNASWVGDPVLGHAEEESKEGLFSSVRYDVVSGIPGRLLDLDWTSRFVSAQFRGKVEEKEALEFLRQCVLKYGSRPERSYVGKHRRVTFSWIVGQASIFVTIDCPKPQQKQEISLLISPSAAVNVWNQPPSDSLDEEGLKEVFEPFQPTLDQAMKEMHAREVSARVEESVREEAARKERRWRLWTRVALYSGLGVVLLAFIFYRWISP